MRSPLWDVVCAESLAFLATCPENSVDAVVTDPPAGIAFMENSGKADWDCFRRANNPADVDRDNVFGRASRTSPHSYGESDRGAFIAFLTAIMAECLRVLKPGGHAFVWALPRTAHWTTMAIEDAGFEIRDSVQHVFATGMLKGLNVAKAIQKADGVAPIGSRPASLGMVTGPNKDAWNACQTQLVMPEPEGEAAEWDGWNTALAPGHEVWILARKPLSEDTVAANVRRWGTGAINVGACRVPANQRKKITKKKGENTEGTNVYGAGLSPGSFADGTTDEARMPKNIVFSHSENCLDVGDRSCGEDETWACVRGCPVRALDEQGGERKTSSGIVKKTATGAGHQGTDYGKENRPEGTLMTSYGDAGGPSRFFTCLYQAKSPKSEKNAGLPEGTTNQHPTPKSISLLQHLVRLLTPPGGLVLDCFGGSGSTGLACIREGFDCLLVEKDPNYCEIARARIGHEASKQGESKL